MTALALAPAPMTMTALVARMAPVALPGRVPAARLRVAPAVLARIRLIVVRAGARVRFPVIRVIRVTRVAVVAVARLAAREVTGGRRAWLLTTRRLVTGRLAGRPGLAGALARGPPGRITPDRPAVPAPKARPRTRPQTRPGQRRPVQTRRVQTRPVPGRPVLGRRVQTRVALACPVLACPVLACPVLACPVLIRVVPVTVISACLALARRAGTVHSVMACPALAPARRAGTRPENRTTCRR